jgi:hypothetical protein
VVQGLTRQMHLTRIASNSFCVVILSCADQRLGESMPPFIICVILILITLCGFCEGAQEKTLGEIRRELLGREVVIGGAKATGIGASLNQEVLLEWHITEGDANVGYKRKQIRQLDVFAPYELKGRKGVVVSIELAADTFRNIRKGTSTDIFGEKIKDDTVANPYFDLVVRLNDGMLLATRNYYTNMVGNLVQISEKVGRQKDEIMRNINTLVGKVIYPVGYSTIYPQDIEMKEITNILRRDIYKLRIYRI